MAEPLKPEIRIFSDIKTLSTAAAESVSKKIDKSLDEKDIFSMALSGGETPRLLYRYLGTKYRDRVDWQRVHIFWGDERFVPFNDPESNYRTAEKEFLSRVSIPSENIHPVDIHAKDSEAAAGLYEDLLRGFFPRQQIGKSPSFDLVLLGLGEDGHTASLFPDSDALQEKDRWAVAVKAPPVHKTRDRITLTLEAINSSRDVFFLVAGSSKKDVVARILKKPGAYSRKIPASMVRPQNVLTWFLDRDAALGL